MNENKRIASPWIKIVKSVGDKALDEKCVETIQSQTMCVIFNTQNSQLVTWSLPTEFFQVHGQNRPVANLSIVDFLPLAARNAISKAAEYVTFGFSIHTLVFFPL